MTELHKRNWPQSSLNTEETVRIARLDDVVTDLELPGEILLKIDVQGYEDRVLNGAVRTISRCSLVLLEVSFVTLYDGQPLFDNIYTMMKNYGFNYCGNLEQYASSVDGRIMFADAIFERAS
jgi:hypothetical protein